jgi:DNA-binding SARP family transcriptional activator
MPPLELHLFGRFFASFANRSMGAFEGAKVQELLCYLLLHPKAHAREALATVLWADSSSAHSKKYLRQTLWQLQATLEANLGPLPHRLLLVEADWIHLNPALELCVDVFIFERAFSLMNLNGDLNAATVEQVREAVDLYRGDLLEGWYQDWCLFERERLQSMYLTLLDKLIKYSESQRQYDQGLVYAAAVLRYEPASERAHRQMMRLHHLAGDRTSALRQYDRCVAALKAEFGVPPTLRTRALLEQIRTDCLPSHGPSANEVNPENPHALLPEVLDHLKDVRATLSAVQQQVQEDIHTVEVALSGRR